MKKDTKEFTIIVGDLVRSRDIPDRDQFSIKLQSTITKLFEEFFEEFHAPLVLTQGIDELSGVLKQPDKSYRICTLLNERLYPHQFRFAIVRGAIDVAINSEDARQMDGPGFHLAADVIQLAKKENRYYYFKLGFQLPEHDRLITELANLIHLIRSNWSRHQRHIVDLYVKFKHQKTVAEKLGITQQAVSDALQHAFWWDIKQALYVLETILESTNTYK